MADTAPSTLTSRGPGTGQIIGWFVVGALLALSFLAMFTIGMFLLPIALLLAVVLVWDMARRGSPVDPRHILLILGVLIASASTPFLWVTWMNRGGPGERCWQTATAQGCEELLNPWIFATPALVLLGLGLALIWIARRPTR
ncbi:MAG TPA: hypothetical protein GXZ60_01380 [Intrasporangiaceae bacterium]|nr:hypothetical protein [Intrasporangiaceae bacterium]